MPTAIEWCDETWNPLRGTKGRWTCTKISEGCQNCYAERLNLRFGGPEYKHGADMLRLDAEALTRPFRWKRPRRIFVCSMTDLFEERVQDEWIDRVFAVMALAPQHTFQVLTKRAERMFLYCSWWGRLEEINEAARKITGQSSLAVMPTQRHGMSPGGWPLPNVWLGVSVENQARADERIPWLLRTSAAVRFLSVEPLLGPVDLKPRPDRETCLLEHPHEGHPCRRDGLNWVIIGGESGGPPERALVEKAACRCLKTSRPYHLKECGALLPKPDALDWVRALRDQCVAAGVSFFHKQWGGPTPKSGGRLLDGRIWDEMPN